MSRRKAEVPSLADALAKGFADLKAGEEETPPVEEVIKTTEVIEKEDEAVSKPEYGRPSQHVAEQTSFVVSGKGTDQLPEPDSQQPEPEKVKILDRPSTSIGDDFDVEW